jgi:hypothetical protein
MHKRILNTIAEWREVALRGVGLGIEWICSLTAVCGAI